MSKEDEKTTFTKVEKSPEQLVSEARTNELSRNIFGAIDETKKTNPDLNVYEVIDSLLRIAHNYNKSSLMISYEPIDKPVEKTDKKLN
ncbi:hypothetical protein HWC99_gp31 [Flavobacterium phage vB_FspS_tant8-1]|uniref:Uncharacterized protein n=1 Tax=Flavobacterium phage vB_FspS_tant8-1 TaxID=2686278 RepID=A0A6B9LG57_9CAUD|nr:hypothetical protein HWC99_gp31 [Flavobacterium phage vB_FspS_tant8-1]QHB40962.1 hypothetical protein tant81_gp031 [Flavobacterium phage vB_FspS_tant8-1]